MGLRRDETAIATRTNSLHGKLAFSVTCCCSKRGVVGSSIPRLYQGSPYTSASGPLRVAAGSGFSEVFEALASFAQSAGQAH